ncbi:hypothetical protein NPX13_g6989 [Xylaria arbuscula]|uniref:DUF7587 domain-containing protein n=1 Tax=Xylaria arbuscula TaxID=114810 RepID=A0A9W8NBJ3_9PEZI|nr:hypothetical protein NPX13_g6989 [Xylaria arbuscula]
MAAPALPQSLPTNFYRVQDEHSFTLYDNSGNNGFESRGHYCMDYSHWINQGRFNAHLDWKHKTSEPTPFISVFDNEDDAKTWAAQRYLKKCRKIIVVRIFTRDLKPIVLPINFQERTVQLPAWEHPSGCVFLSTYNVRRELSVPVSVSRESEWFALDFIPATMITGVKRFP